MDVRFCERQEPSRSAKRVEGEKSWPTQPFPSAPPALSPQEVKAEDIFGADLTGDWRSAGFPAANLPCPEKAEAFAMPSDDRVRLDDGQG